jgi:predicted TIM-barrel fold metal-dependent hydrolase
MEQSMLREDKLAFLNRTMDVDAHEMAPHHFWEEMYGESGGRLAKIAEPLLKKLGGNDFYNPSVTADDLELNEANVLTIRGVKAPSAFDFSRRTAAMDLLGARRQLVFPGFGLIAMLLFEGNPYLSSMASNLSPAQLRKLGETGVDAHNDWAVRTSALDPDRLRIVGFIKPSDSVEQLVRQAEDLTGRGIRAVQILAGSPPGGRSPAHPDLDPFWSLLAERNIACTIHVGGEGGFLSSAEWRNAPAFAPGKVESHELGLEPYSFATLHFAVSNWLTCMVLGGVFERHPTLRFGAIEWGADWLGPLAERLDMFAKAYATRLARFISLRPSEYLNRNVRVTPFNNFEPIEEHFKRYPQVANSFCYSTDYPHIEGGTNIKAKFYKRLESFGDEVLQNFFVNNGELLLPA